MSNFYVTPQTVIPPDVPLTFTGNTGSGSAIANNFDIVGTGGVTTSVVGDTLTISASTGSFTWTVVTSASNPVTLVNENGYICKGALPINFILPAASAIGDSFKIRGYGNLWTIAQNAGQTITIGNVTSTLGVGGSIQATMISDGIELLTVSTNMEFYSTYLQGNVIII
jgi:hypothetical protein